MRTLFSLLALTLCAVCRSEANRWGINDPELVREYIAPETSLGEPEVDWRPILGPIAEEITAPAKTPLEAAMLLNRHLWKRIGVIYSTKRDRPNQDPLHSMRIGLASCSGLSILLADACRAVGIPARLVGCQWRNKPGNHTWVEVWSEGAWFPLGAFEDCPPDSLWFLDDAAQAIADDPRYAIYATRATLNAQGTRFWDWGVPADNVTARYLRPKAKSTTNGLVRVYIAAERGGVRVAEPFVCQGQRRVTPGPLQDLNDYTVLELPEGAEFTLEFGTTRFTHRAQANAIFVEQLP